MINPQNFPDWQFTDHRDCHFSFNYKSPRLKQFVHFLSENYNTDKLNEELIEHEKLAYLTQIMLGVSFQLQGLQTDLRRQFKLHIDRGISLPSELKACVDLKIV